VQAVCCLAVAVVHCYLLLFGCGGALSIKESNGFVPLTHPLGTATAFAAWLRSANRVDCTGSTTGTLDSCGSCWTGGVMVIGVGPCVPLGSAVEAFILSGSDTKTNQIVFQLIYSVLRTMICAKKLLELHVQRKYLANASLNCDMHLFLHPSPHP